MGVANLILVVDDDATNRELLEGLLETLGYESLCVSSGEQALACLQNGAPDKVDLVLLDVMMPDMNGYEVARCIRDDPEISDLPIIMVTALSSREDRLLAVESGANDFISKPIDRTELKIRVASLLKMKEAQDLIKRHRAELEITVQERTYDLQQALREVTAAQLQTQDAHMDTIYRLAVASEYKDRATALHIKRVSEYCALIARNAGLSEQEQDLICAASPMHDVGKLGIPDAILLKAGKLDEEEWAIMQRHTTIGQKILCGSSSELLKAGEIIAISHHEKWDGSGYPNHLSGTDIPLWGRICAVADVFDALTQARPYKVAFPSEQSFGIMCEGRGRHFDPDLLDLFLELKEEALGIRRTYSSEPLVHA